MMKFIKMLFKIVFSRTLIIFILLLFQAFVLFACFTWLGSYMSLTMSGMTLLGALLIFYIINRDELPEFKMTWILVICALPVLGALLYVYINNNLGSIGLKKKLDRRLEETGRYLGTTQAAESALAACEDQEMINLAAYMQRVGGYPACGNSSVTYFPCGEEKFADLLRELEKAEKFIFLEYFIIERGVMWDAILEILKRKAAEGVEVRVMYDGMCSLLLLPYSYPKKLSSFGIKAKMFESIKPFLTTDQNNRDHRKILVIDGRVAYNGGINLADEYINVKKLYGHWKDVAVKVEGEAVNSFTLMFLQMWNATESGAEEYENYLRRDIPERKGAAGIVMPYADAPTRPENVAETVYMDIINHARRYVHIMTPYFIVDGTMLNALKYAAQRGVDVKLIMPHIPDKKMILDIGRTFYPALLHAGVEVYEYTPGFVHAKMFLSDDDKAVAGTINLDYRSLYHHFECATYIYRNPVISEMEEDYRRTLSECQTITMEDYRKLPLLKRLDGRVMRLFAPLM